MDKVESKSSTTFIMNIIKGSLYALSVSLILILVFAFLLRFIAIEESVISPAVQVIKGVSILIGVLIALKSVREMGFVNGLAIGLTYTIISFICFSMLDGFSFEFSKTLLNDIILGSIIGGITGIIAVNFKKGS
ncbi:MAG: TIGR04086 family membrane protein [Clostridia bacterium]|nr:TIGR04086 family membrane protein [Clostridia bacterium]MDD4686065.1 TIGR04086 family membrane protein [Clostridia bacterium]